MTITAKGIKKINFIVAEAIGTKVMGEQCINLDLAAEAALKALKDLQLSNPYLFGAYFELI